MTLWVRWKKLVKLAITCKQTNDVENAGDNTRDNCIRIEMTVNSL